MGRTVSIGITDTIKKVAFMFCFIVLLFYQIVYIPVKALEPPEEYDIEIVIDVSGSMDQTDAGQAAIEMLVNTIGLLEETNTRIGFVGYNHEIAYQYPLIDIRSAEEREALRNYLQQIRFYGDTDIGLGIRRAAETLIENNRDSKKIILLISDGESDLPEGKYNRTLADSRIDEQTGVQMAKERGISIYTIGLTNKFDGNVDALRAFSTATKGESYTANSSYQLVEAIGDILKKYYFYTFSEIGYTGELIDEEDGIKWKNDVPDASLSRMSVLFFSAPELENISVLSTSEDFRIERGKFGTNLVFYHPPHETMSIRVKKETQNGIVAVVQTVYSLTEQIILPTEEIKREEIPAQLFFHSSGEEISDLALYQDLSVEFIVTESESNDIKRYPAQADGNRSTAALQIDKSGIYEVYAEYSGTYLKGRTPSQIITITNKVPFQNQEIEKTMPGKFRSSKIDLSTLFIDEDGDNLALSVIGKKKRDISKEEDILEIDLEEVNLQGTTLYVKPQEYGNFTYLVQAVDEEGESCVAEVNIDSQPIWKYYYTITILIVIVLIVLIAVFLSYFIWKHYHNKPIELPPIRTADPFFEGYLTGYILTLKSGEEIEPLKWNLQQYHRKNFTIQELMEEKGLTFDLLGADQIELRAAEARTIQLFHRTNCLIIVGSSEIPRREKVTIHYGDKIYICFEDGISEIELRYKSS